MESSNPILLLTHPDQFPSTENALTSPDGLLAASQAIDSTWLQCSYQKGIFPWYSEGEPVLWWSPNPRAVLYTDQFKLHRSLRKAIRKASSDPRRRLTLNHAFEQVIIACAQPRKYEADTWIGKDIFRAYTELHQKGLAHSVEYWLEDQLIGGLYCVAIGAMVFGESMFTRETDASKVAFSHFVGWLRNQNVSIIDCQQATSHLQSLGAVLLPRAEFEAQLSGATQQPGPNWTPKNLEWMDESA